MNFIYFLQLKTFLHNFSSQIAAAVTGTKFCFCVSMVGAVEVSGDVWIQNDSKMFVKLVWEDRNFVLRIMNFINFVRLKTFLHEFWNSSSGNWIQIQFLCFNGWGSWSVSWCWDSKWLVKCLFVKLVWKDIDNLIDNRGKNKQNVKENMKSWHIIVWGHWSNCNQYCIR